MSSSLSLLLTMASGIAKLPTQDKIRLQKGTLWRDISVGDGLVNDIIIWTIGMLSCFRVYVVPKKENDNYLKGRVLEIRGRRTSPWWMFIQLLDSCDQEPR